MEQFFDKKAKNNDIFVIAEIGKNFIQTEDERPMKEYLKNAKALIDAAVYAGADAVKFQTHEVEDEQHPNVNVVSPHFKGSARFAWVKRNTETTPIEFWRELKKYCDKKGIIFFSTPMSRKAAIKLDKVGVPFWKVGSGDVFDFALLDYIGNTGKPIIFSTGMSSHKELEEVVSFLSKKKSPIAILYCISEYPAPKEYFNLSTIKYLKEKFPKAVIGFSDHSLGHDVSLAAAKVGARIIEKHFSLDRNLWGADHKVSMTPEEMKKMIEALRNGKYKGVNEKPYLGEKKKELEGANNKFRPYFNKTLVAGTDIGAGTTITPEMLYAMRPMMHLDGIPSKNFPEILGRKISRDIKKFEPLTWNHLEEYKDEKGEVKTKRKVCFVITSFIHYSRNLLILEELKKRSDIDLHILIGGAALISKYSAKHAHVKELLLADGFKNIYEVYFNLEGDNDVVKAKTAGLGIIEFSLLYNNIKPDVVVVRGDRFEVLSAALAASYMHIPVAHIEGGDVTGTFDETVRHTITKLSHIHFATHEEARERIIRMGEPANYVFNFGSPEVELVCKVSKEGKICELGSTGSGAEVDLKKPYIMVMYHPVTTEKEILRKNTETLLKAVHEIGIQTLWFWPNFDAGAEEISSTLRTFNDEMTDHKIRFLRYLPPRDFLSLLNNAKCLVGNSSAGIKECSYLGLPVINVGSRQNMRFRAENVIDVYEDKNKIKEAIIGALSNGRFKQSESYLAENTAKNIAEVLATANLYTQKMFNDASELKIPSTIKIKSSKRK